MSNTFLGRCQVIALLNLTVPCIGAMCKPSMGRLPSSPLLHITFNLSNPNYMSTFHQDGTDIQILDMCSPGVPMMEL